MKRFAVRTTIEATPERVWEFLTDAPRYPAWNTTVSRIDGSIALGATLTVHVNASSGGAFPVKVVTYDAPRRLVWSSGMPLGLFLGERTFELLPASSHSVEFVMNEEYTGLLAPLITKSIPDLQPAFNEFAACLKACAERS